MTATNGLRTALGRRTVLAAAIAALSLAGGAKAFAAPALVDLQVVDRDTGQVLQVWRHDGRLFVAGRPGARYALRVTNNTNGRVEVVISVDGVSIYTGETAGFDQRGYIFSPHETYDLTGWRKSLAQVAAFTFAPQSQSYAARTGRPANVGVIGMAVFTEKLPDPVPMAPPIPTALTGDSEPDRQVEPPRQPAHHGRRYRLPPPIMPQTIPSPPTMEPVPPPPPPAPPPPVMSSTPSSQANAVVVTAERREEKLGTGHGDIEDSVIHYVSFYRATVDPQMVWQVEYDTWGNLVARGVIPRDDGRHPQPFPAQSGGNGFVPDPPPEP
jgi:hypothetical protein